MSQPNTLPSRTAFINCPYDEDYIPLLRALSFTLIYAGYDPELSSSVSHHHYRIQNIRNLIGQSVISFHDLSRTESDPPRFNMPFEFGLDEGYKAFNEDNDKRVFVLVKEDYDYLENISDIAGRDPIRHHGDPQKMVRRVADTLQNVDQSEIGSSDRIQYIWQRYEEWLTDLQISIEDEDIYDDPSKAFEYTPHITSNGNGLNFTEYKDTLVNNFDIN